MKLSPKKYRSYEEFVREELRRTDDLWRSLEILVGESVWDNEREQPRRPRLRHRDTYY